MTLKVARGTRALMAFEDSGSDLLFERISGSTVPLWPIVRAGFMTAMQDADYGSAPIASNGSSKLSAWTRLLRSLLPGRWDASRLRSRRRIAYLVGGVTTHTVDGRLRNWLVGDYAEQYPDASVVLQWSSIGTPAPRFDPTHSLDPMAARSEGFARLSRSRVDGREVHKLVRAFADHLDARIADQQVDAIAASAAYGASTAPHFEAQFARMLDRVAPEVVIMEDASYGSRARIIALLKSRGILVAEPQHGWIGPTHGAYNFGAAMREPALFATLPDELLTFGEYWGTGIRHPASITAVGKPHLEAMTAAAPQWDERPREVLIVSSVSFPEETTAFTLALRRVLPSDWLIRFRPHPSERATLHERYAGMFAVQGIASDENKDVYDSLARARAVIGTASTVLFEALAMGCRVFVRDSPYVDYYVGDLFGPVTRDSEVERLAHQILAGQATVDRATLESIWKPDAIRNFRAWAEERLQPSA